MKDSLAGQYLSRCVVLGTLCAILAGGGPRLAAETPAANAGARQYLRSTNVSLYTDLSTPQAHALLERLEATLDFVSAYWKRPLRGTIQCYVAEHLDNWHDRELPHPMARILIGRVGGAAIAVRVVDAERESHKIVVLAAARPGVAEHEVVHAYCGQTFGTTGPLWYREGMAQMLTSGHDVTHGLDFPPEIQACLTADKKQSLAKVVQSGQNVQQLCDSFDDKTAAHDGLVGLVPDSAWNNADIQSLEDIKHTYAWSWLACQLLEHNPNYRSRFQTLGQDYLVGRKETFSKHFDPVARELLFEYEFTVAHMTPGYRVDLCAWDWSKRIRRLTGNRPYRVRVDAARGYQASGLVVTARESYAYKATGSWTTDAQAGATSADGRRQDRGRLEAVVMRDYQLSEPILLGREGTFSAPGDGQLYLRCRDHWGQLGDNDGSVVVALTPAK